MNTKKSARFKRRTKKAFVSFAPRDLISRVSAAAPLKRDNVHTLTRRKKLKLRFGDIREAHGTFITRFLRQPEIDFLHGRISMNVFMANYFNPALIGDLKERAFKAAEVILAEIS